jgi:hypothetical protein
MNDSIDATIQFLQQQAAALLLYQAVFEDEVGQAFLQLLQACRQSNHEGLTALKAYGNWFQAMAREGVSWRDRLVTQIVRAENPFTQQAQRLPLADMPPALVAAAQADLRRLQSLYHGTDQFSQWIEAEFGLKQPLVQWESPAFHPQDGLWQTFQTTQDWADLLPALAEHYRRAGIGLFAAYHACRWQQGQLVGVAYPDPIQLEMLVGYELPKATLLQNTEALLAGYSALNVLLYGSRGTGKSSLVKSLVHAYGDRGLRLIEVEKADLRDLPAIVEQVRRIPHSFIIFVDDLSFEEDDETFKALKVVLEGSLTARPQNVVVYATSNRRHLVREFYGDRPRPSDADEIHNWDTMQEKLSFSDRFGLTLTFEPADQETYLAIVRHLAKIMAIDITPSELEFRALQWATRHNGRSGRSARQFIDFLVAEKASANLLP